MQLREQILSEHSRANCDAIVKWVGASQQRFDELFALFLHGGYRVTQRAAWPIGYCVAAHPALIQKNFGKLIKNLLTPNLHNAVKRNTVRLLQYVSIPKKYQGPVMDICFGYVASPTEPVAVKAFSLTVLGNLARQYPDIIPEIKLLVQEQLPHQTAAFYCRAKKLLQQWGTGLDS
jgi:hypothetical protein